jgi:hypothetical protein
MHALRVVGAGVVSGFALAHQGFLGGAADDAAHRMAQSFNPTLQENSFNRANLGRQGDSDKVSEVKFSYQEPERQIAFEGMQATFPEVAHLDLHRFLKARGFDEANATAMLTKHLQWRIDTLPIKNTEEVQESLSSRRYYYLCQDEADRPVIYIQLQRFMKEEYDVDAEINAYLWFIENEVIPKMKEGGPQTCTVLIDVQGITSPPTAFLTKFNDIFEANYPERLHKTVIFPVPWLLQTIIKGVLLFVDKDTRKKARFRISRILLRPRLSLNTAVFFWFVLVVLAACVQFRFVDSLELLLRESGVTEVGLGGDIASTMGAGHLRSTSALAACKGGSKDGSTQAGQMQKGLKEAREECRAAVYQRRPKLLRVRELLDAPPPAQGYVCCRWV